MKVLATSLITLTNITTIFKLNWVCDDQSKYLNNVHFLYCLLEAVLWTNTFWKAKVETCTDSFPLLSNCRVFRMALPWCQNGLCKDRGQNFSNKLKNSHPTAWCQESKDLRNYWENHKNTNKNSLRQLDWKKKKVEGEHQKDK